MNWRRTGIFGSHGYKPLDIISLVIKSILEFLRGNMVEMKVYTTFNEGDRYEMTTTEENVIASIKELMQVLQTRKIDCLHISPNEEVRIQYKDNRVKCP